jgi:peptide/nickel transport system permease protein
MAKLIVNRLLLGVLTLFAVSVLIFVCTQILPGDVASAVLGQGATPEALIVFRRELGLDVPAHLRYWNWLVGALHGDLGVALTNKRVIIDDLLPRLRNTLFLAGYAAVIAIPFSVGLGILAAINEGKLSDRLSNVLTLVAISLPEFFIAYILIIFFSVEYQVFPSLAMVSKNMEFSERLFQTTLPALTLTLLVAAHMLRMTRSSVLSVMSTPYIEMAVLKGAPRARVLARGRGEGQSAPEAARVGALGRGGPGVELLGLLRGAGVVAAVVGGGGAGGGLAPRLPASSGHDQEHCRNALGSPLHPVAL